MNFQDETAQEEILVCGYLCSREMLTIAMLNIFQPITNIFYWGKKSKSVSYQGHEYTTIVLLPF